MKDLKLFAGKTIAMILTLAGMVIFSTNTARAQKPEGAPGEVQSTTAVALTQDADLLERRIQRLELFERQRKDDEARERRAQQFEGSWVVTVTPAVPPGVPQPPSFRGYATVARGGGYFGSDRTRPFSKQHGSWEYNGGDEFLYTFTEDLFDPAGAFAGTIVVRVRLTIIGADEFVGVSNGEQRDPAGNVLFNRCATVRGERIKIEALSPQCLNIVPPQ